MISGRIFMGIPGDGIACQREPSKERFMLKLFNSLSKRMEPFEPANKALTTVFTCGPSIYQRAHIGNFRTFLFEDILVRYLEYLGYVVRRGMNVTDIEDKAISEARQRKISLQKLVEKNIRDFREEMRLLKMKTPDYLPRASDAVEEAVAIIERLLNRGIAYRYGGNIYFDPLKFPDFGRLYGLDMTRWPAKKRRFHRDTYPGIQWNLGDFILWHGCREGDTVCWDSRLGRGRPSWNIQDPSMISKHYDETLSIYCGGVDNLFRHHDYTRAVLESIRPFPVAKYWLHCHHLRFNGKKMSKRTGNICYTDTLLDQGYDRSEIRFFLIYGGYRKRLNYSTDRMRETADKLRQFKSVVRKIEKRAGRLVPSDGGIEQRLGEIFTRSMDNDLDVKGGFDGLCRFLAGIRIGSLMGREAATIRAALHGIDNVLGVVF
jgi:cysteinyl-tRNA synthetase